MSYKKKCIKNINERLIKAENILNDLLKKLDLNLNIFKGKEVISKEEKDELSKNIHEILYKRASASWENIISNEEVNKCNLAKLDSFTSYIKKRINFENKLEELVELNRNKKVNY